MAVETGEEEEDVEFGEETLQDRRRKRKKRKEFFTTISNADSGSEKDPKSPGPSNHGSGRGEGSTAGDDNDDFSESGFLTDPCLLSRLMERFTFGVRNHESIKGMRQFNRHSPGLPGASMLPTLLHLKYLAALLTLAVIGRPNSSITIADMTRLFNSEALAWKSAVTFLPPSYTPSNVEEKKLRGEKMFSTKMLSVLVFRLASFLHGPNSMEKQINLAFSLPTLKNHKKFPFTFKSILGRLLLDLSLPSVLCKDIYTAFKRLHLTNIVATLHPYTPDNQAWVSMMFPLVSKRILALILFTLKFHCGLDDQYEVLMSHNIVKMSTLTSGINNNFFDPLTWLRLSKLRLDQIMSQHHVARDQYHSLAHMGTPDLKLPSLAAKLTEDDKIHQGAGGQDSNPDKRFSDLTKLMSDLTVGVKKTDNCDLTIHPLLDMSRQLLQSGSVRQVVKKSVSKLLDLPSSDMSIFYDLPTCSVRASLHKDHGLAINAEFREKKEKRLRLAKNWVATDDFGQDSGTNFNPAGIVNPVEGFKLQRKAQFLEMVMSGRTRKSGYRVPHTKSQSDKFFKVTKSYWFAHQYTLKQIRRDNTITNEGLLTDQILDTIPANFAWILKYFACYSHLPPLELLEELNEIEKMFLVLDPDYFGLPRKLKKRIRLLPWKGKKVQVGKKTKKGVTGFDGSRSLDPRD